MKTFARKILPALIMALTLCLSTFAVVGCNNDSGKTDDVPVTSVLMGKNQITLDPGQEETLKAYTNIDATNKALTWTSDKEAVATVDNNGKVTAVAEGTAKITATSVANKDKSATCTVTVNKAKGKVLATIQGLDATDAVSATDTLTFRDDGTYSVFAMFLSAVEVKQDSTYTITNGVLTVAKPEPTVSTAFGDFATETLIEVYGNTVKFQVWSENTSGPICLGNYVIDEATAKTLGITVGEAIQEVNVTGLNLKEESITVESGSVANFDEVVEIQPADATNKKYTVAVTLDLTNSLMQDGENLKGVKEGTAYVTIKTVDGGFEKNCAVKVEYPTKTLAGENYFANDTAFAGALDLSAFGGSKMDKLYICKADGMVEIYDNYKLVQLGYYTLTGAAGNYTKIDCQRFSDGDGSFDITTAASKMSFDAGNALLPLVMTECELDMNAHFETQKVFTASLFGGAITKTWTFNSDGTMTDESEQTGTYSIFSVDGKFISLTMNLVTDGTSTYTLVLDSSTSKYSFEVLGAIATEADPSPAE